MFYYLSFLRPPPISAVIGAPISLTPQIANDLRTENYPGAVDIFYHWRDTVSDAQLSTVIKLTTWREANAYKEITISPPPLRKPGQATLVLTSTQTANDRDIDLRSPDCGKPLPVFSTPIAFSQRLPGKGSKQESVDRVFRIFDHEDNSRVRVREMTSFDLDKKLWDSGVGLSSWLVRQSLLTGSPAGDLKAAVWNAMFSTRECHVVELGAGTGVVSLVLSALRHALHPDAPTDILATDLPSSIELMRYNVAANALIYPKHPPRPIVLDWDDDDLPMEVVDMGAISLIIAADITYNTASFPALIKTLRHLLSHSPDALVLLAYKERDFAERELWTMAREQVSLGLLKIDDVAGAGGQAVEIWAGKRLV